MLVRWLRVNEDTQEGVGYYIYSAGSFKYDSAFGVLEFYVDPLVTVKKTAKTKITQVNYHLYISPTLMHLSEAAQCERYL